MVRAKRFVLDLFRKSLRGQREGSVPCAVKHAVCLALRVRLGTGPGRGLAFTRGIGEHALPTSRRTFVLHA
eukprot:6188424-Pleurochrysis_carterae.AAC.1